MLARKIVDRAQALFDAGQAFRIEIEAIEQAPQRIRSFARLRLRARGEAFRFGKALVQRQQAAQAGQRGRELVVDAGLAAVEQLLGAEALVEQAAGIRELLVLGVERRQLVLAERERIELLQLVAQVFELGRIAALRRDEAFALAVDALDLARCGRDGVEQCAVVRVVVEQPALGIGLQQRAAVALAEDLDELLAELAQIAGRDRRAVHERARAAFGVDHAADRAVLAVAELALGQPGADAGAAAERELGRDLRLVGAAADQRGIGAQADHEAERVDQDRLAGAGLAGQHAEALGPVKAQFVDDREIADVKMSQHSVEVRSCRGRCRACGPSAACREGVRSSCSCAGGSGAAHAASG